MRKLLIAFMIGCLATAAFAAKPADESKRVVKPRINPTYTIHYAKIKPDLDEFKGDWKAYWNSPAWKQASTVTVDQWTTRSTPARPSRTQAKALYDENGIRVLWRVEKDPYLRCIAEKFGDRIYNDGSVEFYFEPSKEKGYISLATNACGVYRWRVQTPPDGAKAYEWKDYIKKEATEDIALKVLVKKSVEAKTIEPAITTGDTWYLETLIPGEVLNWAWGMKTSELVGATWRGNFFKLFEGGKVGNTYWHAGSWSNLGKTSAEFHQSAQFGTLKFEDPAKTEAPEAKASK